MDFNRNLKEVAAKQDQILELQAELKTEMVALERKMKEAGKFTETFLKECAKLGLKKVAIQKAHKSIPASERFPFGPSGSVFAEGNEQREDGSEGWPLIWEAVKRLGISGGAGNSNQHGITLEGSAKLIDGVYHLRSGKWKRID